MLTYNEFETKMLQVLGDQFPGITLERKDMLKLNQTVKKGTVLMLKENTEMSPIIYLEDWYQTYQTGKSFEEISEEAALLLSLVTLEKSMEWQQLLESHEIKKLIYPGLINYEKNKEYLASNNLVYKRFLDLAVIYQIRIESTEAGERLMRITENMLTQLEMNIEQLDMICRENCNYTVQSLDEILFALTEIEDTVNTSLLVLCDNNHSYGAAGMIYSDIIEKMATEEETDYYILPSSVFEVLLLKRQEDITSAQLKAMVCEINGSDVIAPEEWLSDSIYIYRHDIKKIEIVS